MNVQGSLMHANFTKKDEFNREGGGGKQTQSTQRIRTTKKVGRNDPCPCGSGKKYKHCHGIKTTADA